MKRKKNKTNQNYSNFSGSPKENKICELLTRYSHGQNSKQLVFQTNNSTSSTWCQSKACNFMHHYKKHHKENCSATVRAGQKLQTTLILEICLRKLCVLANKPDLCLPSWQRIQKPHWQKNSARLKYSLHQLNSYREEFSLARWEMHGRVTEQSPGAVLFCPTSSFISIHSCPASPFPC